MAKLQITLDGIQVGEVPVDKERITIGRRADNDIQLDHIAVSGQHAAVVTILNDSFLEDLGSTNGTMVNGGTVRKHFLRDGDLVEIGRHRMRFVGEVLATRELADFEKTMVLNRPTAAPRPAATGEVRTATVSSWNAGEAPAEVGAQLAEMLESPATAAEQALHAEHALMDSEVQALMAATAAPALVEAEAAAASDAPGTVTSAPQAHPVVLPQLSPELRSGPVEAPVSAPAVGATAIEPDSVVSVPSTAAVASSADAVVAEVPALSPGAAALLNRIADLSSATLPEPASHPALPVVPTAVRQGEPQARLQVLNGTAAGRILEINKPLTTIGRPSVQVAVISRRSDGFYLAQVDGDQPARLNGSPLVPHAVGLHAHDILEIAGIKLEFFFQ
jgi:hypothetical protein